MSKYFVTAQARADAAPGTTVAQLVKDSPPPQTLPVVTAPTAVPPDQAHYILPNARDRWMAVNLHYYTPKRVENIARGAMSGNLVAQWQMFDLMEQTWPRLTKNLNELKDAVVDLDWNLKAYAPKDEKPTSEAERRAKLVGQVLADMDPDIAANENDFDDTIRDIMDAVGKGISVQEIYWQFAQLVNGGQAWKPRATRHVNPRFYGYPAYGQGEDRLMLYGPEVKFSNPNAKVADLWTEIPRENFIVSIIKQKSGHPLNSSLLRILGFIWAAQNYNWEWFLNLAQIFGSPIRWATYDPTNKSLLGLVTQMLQQMGSMGFAAFPEGTKLELKEGVQNARENPQKLIIDMSDQIVDIVILGQTLTSSQGDRGSQALGKVHKGVRDEKIQASAGRSAKILKQLLRAICIKNFGDDSQCPSFAPSAKQGKNTLEKAETFQIVLQSGAPIPRQHFYDQLDIPVPAPGEEVILPTPAAAAAKPPGDDGDSEDDNDPATAQARGSTALEDLTGNVLERVTGVQHRWLAQVKPTFRTLIAAAKNGDLSDAQFLRAIEHAQKHFPELFQDLNRDALAKALEESMSAAAINGAVRGAMTRRVK